MRRWLAIVLVAAALPSARQALAVSTAFMNYSGDYKYDTDANWNQAPGTGGGYISARCNFNGSASANVSASPGGLTLGYGGTTTAIRGIGELHVQSSTLTIGSALTLGYSKSTTNSGKLYVEGGMISTSGINNDSYNGTSGLNYVFVTGGTLDLRGGSINSYINTTITGGTVQNLASATAREVSGTAAFSNLTGTLTVNPSAAGTFTSDPALAPAACGITGPGTIVKNGTGVLTFSPGGLGSYNTMNLASGLTVNTAVAFTFELQSPGPSGVGDMIAFAGSGGLTLNAVANVGIVGSLPSAAGNYRLFSLGDAAAPDMTRLNLLTTTGPNAATYALSATAEPGFVDLVVVPGICRWYGDGVNQGGDGTWTGSSSTWNTGSGSAPLPQGAKALFDLPSGQVTVGAGGVTAAGGMQFVLGTAFTLAGGTITLGGASAGDNTLNVESFSTATIAAPLAGSAGLTKSGSGELVLSGGGTLAGNARVTDGTLRVAHPGALGTAAVSVSGGSLAVGVGATLGATVVDGAGRLVLDSAETTTLTVGSLTLGSGSPTVDLGVGRIAITSGADATALRTSLLAGLGGSSNWSGSTGITSSAAAASGGTRTVGYRVAADGSALVAFAAPGDANLDGVVNTLDLVAMTAAGKFGTGAAAVWTDGDFNYDGVVNSLDLVAIGGSNVWGQGNYLPLPAGTTLAAVPEPAASLLLATAALTAGVVAAGRRRGRRRRGGPRAPRAAGPAGGDEGLRPDRRAARP